MDRFQKIKKTKMPMFIFFRNGIFRFLMLVLLVSIFSCSKRQSLKIQWGESSIVILDFRNLSDSLALQLYNFPVFSSSKFEETYLVLPGEKEKIIVLPCEYPSLIHVFIGNNGYSCCVIPKDTLKITVSFTDSSKIQAISFAGNTKSICDYYLEKQQELGYHDLRIPLNRVSGDLDDILKNTDSLLNTELSFIKNYPGKNQLPEWFVNTEISQITYLCNSFKYSREAYITKRLKKTFNPGSDYYRSVDTLKIDNQDAIYSYWYYYFLKSHLVHRKLNLEGLSTKDWMDLTTKTALEQASINLSKEVRDIFSYDYLYSYLKWTKNPDDFDSIFSAGKSNFTNQEYISILTEYRNELTDSLVQKRNDEVNISSVKSLKTNDPVPYFYLQNMEGIYFTTKNFKDKIVYINFWATWCKSCIETIPHKNSLIEKYKDHKEVVFLNICISSDNETWKKILKEKPMAGINLFANEKWSTIIGQNFGIDALPAYFLVKNAKIVKPFCDSPLNIEDDLQLIMD